MEPIVCSLFHNTKEVQLVLGKMLLETLIHLGNVPKDGVLGKIKKFKMYIRKKNFQPNTDFIFNL